MLGRSHTRYSERPTSRISMKSRVSSLSLSIRAIHLLEHMIIEFLGGIE